MRCSSMHNRASAAARSCTQWKPQSQRRAGERWRRPYTQDASATTPYGSAPPSDTPVNPARVPSWDSTGWAILNPVGGSVGRSSGSRSLIG